jgi:spore coat protein U-like protein
MAALLRGLFAAIAGALVLVPDALDAATATANFQVRITIQTSCIVVSANDLDFGTQGVLSTNVDVPTTLSVQCTTSTPYNIGLNAGTGAGATVACGR